MVRTKKDIMGDRLYRAVKKHPMTRNPILIAYVLTPIIVVIGAIIYYMLK